MMDLKSFPEVINACLKGAPLAPLGPGRPNAPFRDQLSQAASLDWGIKIVDRQAAEACVSGLYSLHNFLDESHEISQELHTWYGSYWHGIMHRREPDAWNSKYWFRQVGAEPITALLVPGATALGYTYTSPSAFVDYCEAHRDRGTPQEAIAQGVQQLEWEVLFAACWKIAVG